MSTTALFTMAKMWKQPKRPLTYEWVNKMWCVRDTHTHTHWEVVHIQPVGMTFGHMLQCG